MAATEVTVAVSGATWAAAHLVFVPFVPDSVSVVNLSTTPADVVYVSFNKGETVAATLTPGSAQVGYNFDVGQGSMWLRRASAGSAVSCRVVFTKRM